MKSETKEMRMFEFEIRAEGDEESGARISGRPIVFNSMTDMGRFDEVIDSGALDNADLRDVRFLVNHDVNMIPLARSRNNNANSTMRLEVVPEEGLDISVMLDTEQNADARSLYSAIVRGDITGMSFMMIVGGDRWEGLDSERPVRHITDIARVLEVSAVTFPAYAATSISARGLADALESADAALDSAMAAKRADDRKRRIIKMLLEV